MTDSLLLVVVPEPTSASDGSYTVRSRSALMPSNLMNTSELRPDTRSNANQSWSESHSVSRG